MTKPKLPDFLTGPPSAVYRLLGCQGREVCSGEAQKMPTESVTKTVVEKQVIQFEMCIYNLIDGVSTFNGIKSKNACTERNIVMSIGPAGTTHQVVVTFKENGGCQRNGRFTLSIRGEFIVIFLVGLWLYCALIILNL